MALPSDVTPQQFLLGEWHDDNNGYANFGEDSRIVHGIQETQAGFNGTWRVQKTEREGVLFVNLELENYDWDRDRTYGWSENWNIEILSYNKIIIETDRNRSRNAFTRVNSKIRKIIDDDDAEELKKHLEDQNDIEERLVYGNTLLMYAINARKPKTALLLIEMGADINVLNSRGQTLLDLSSQRTPDNTFKDVQLALLNRGVTISSKEIEENVYNSISLVQTFIGHRNWITCAQFSPCGNFIFSADLNNLIRYWDIASRNIIWRKDIEEGYIYSPVFTKDGTQIYTGAGRRIIVFNALTGEEIKRYPGHPDTINSITLNPDESIVASASDDASMRLWETSSINLMRSIMSRVTLAIKSAVFSPCGNFLLSGSRGTSLVNLWNVSTGEMIRRYNGQDGYIFSVAFSPCGNYIIAGADSGTVVKWNTHTGEMLLTMRGTQEHVKSVDYSPCGKYITAGATDKKKF